MPLPYLLLLLAFLGQSSLVDADTYQVQTVYLDGSCNGTTPYIVSAYLNSECAEETCTDDATSVSCVSDYLQALRDALGSTEYIIQEVFADDDCGTLEYAIGFYVVNDSCVGGEMTNSYTYGYNYTSYLYDNGSAAVDLFEVYLVGSSSASEDSDFTCSASNMIEGLVSKDDLESHSCLEVPTDAKDFYKNVLISGDTNSYQASRYKWYNSNDSTDSGGLSTGAIIGIVCGCIVAVLLVALAIFFYRRRAKGKHGKGLTTTLGTASLEAGLSGQVGLWNDDVITAKRIPRDKVKTKKLISRGAFGEVYTGTYNRQQVAIKVLLPANRSNLQHVNDFLAEAKLTASMDHPQIVSFVGVAWDSLSDLCVVLEFMDNGDLRTLLDKYESSKHPVGIDHQKATIALHVCHALTYLHSLLPPVIHRDLKSRNILLNRDMQAKLTDFGISRERLDQTMTAGVGTSLWMAPEVMLGERYDVKADIFSFGVVLSEVDTHSLPYAQAKKRSLDTDGRQLTDAALLQKITSGTLRVDFSPSTPESLVELGRACVSIDPNDRPTAAEAAYRLQVIISKEL